MSALTTAAQTRQILCSAHMVTMEDRSAKLLEYFQFFCI